METTTRVTADGLDSHSMAIAPTSARGLSSYIELTKPRILTMILLTVVMAMVAAGTSPSLQNGASRLYWNCLSCGQRKRSKSMAGA